MIKYDILSPDFVTIKPRVDLGTWFVSYGLSLEEF